MYNRNSQASENQFRADISDNLHRIIGQNCSSGRGLTGGMYQMGHSMDGFGLTGGKGTEAQFAAAKRNPWNKFRRLVDIRSMPKAEIDKAYALFLQALTDKRASAKAKTAATKLKKKMDKEAKKAESALKKANKIAKSVEEKIPIKDHSPVISEIAPIIEKMAESHPVNSNLHSKLMDIAVELHKLSMHLDEVLLGENIDEISPENILDMYEANRPSGSGFDDYGGYGTKLGSKHNPYIAYLKKHKGSKNRPAYKKLTAEEKKRHSAKSKARSKKRRQSKKSMKGSGRSKKSKKSRKSSRSKSSRSKSSRSRKSKKSYKKRGSSLRKGEKKTPAQKAWSDKIKSYRKKHPNKSLKEALIALGKRSKKSRK